MAPLEKTEPTTRSPVPQQALPHAGESLSEQFRDRWWDILFWGCVPLITLMVALEEWVHYVFKTPPSPFFCTALFLAASVVSLQKIRKIRRDLPQIRLGAHGERIVGEKLEALRAAGYRVFHDIQEEGYNIDHVLIGPEGVFAVETKTRSKPIRGKVEVTYDGERVLINGLPPERDPLIQAKAAARRVRAILKEMTSEEEWVQPVVLFPGWYVTTSVKDPDVIVANEDFFTKGLQRGSRNGSLTKARIDILAAGMERYLRRKG